MAETVAIIGAGAMAQLYAALLQQQGDKPLLLVRPPSKPTSTIATAEHHIHWLDGQIGSHVVSHHPCDVPTQVDAVLLFTKAQDAVDAAQTVLAWLPVSTPLVLLHNGLGPQQQLAQQYPDHNLWAGSVSDGAVRIERWTVAQRGLGVRKAGALGGGNQRLPTCLARLGFEPSQEIELLLWHKLTINGVINPLCGRDGIVNGELLGDRYREEIQQLCAELGQLAQRLGINDDQERCWQRVQTVARATQQNRCSTLQDIEAGRLTELAHISGYLLKQAQNVGLTMPAQQQLFAYHQAQGHVR